MTTVRSSPASRRAALALVAIIAVAGGARVSAHRLDEFLQAARIAIAPGRVQLEMSLTPGTAVADGVVQEIDADRNGVLSRQEQQAYAVRVLEALTVSVDNSPQLRMAIAASEFPEVTALRAGDGAIVIRAQADVSRLAVGPHRLFFRNQHSSGNSVYLANALVPESDEVAVTGQQRDGDQRELMIDFAIRNVPAASGRRWMWIGLAGALMLAAPLLKRTR